MHLVGATSAPSLYELSTTKVRRFFEKTIGGAKIFRSSYEDCG